MRILAAACLIVLAAASVPYLYARKTARQLRWPKTDSFFRLVELCERHLALRGWTVVHPSEATPIPSDILAKRGEVEWFLFLRPAGWGLGPDYLAHASHVATWTGKRVSVLTLDSREEGCQGRVDGLGIDVLDVEEFGMLAETLAAEGHPPEVTTPPFFKDRIAMANRRLMKLARRLKSDAPATRPGELQLQPQMPLIEAVSAAADFVFAPVPAIVAFRSYFPGVSHCSVLTAESGETFLRLSGGAAGAVSTSRTDGFNVQVPDEFEVAASGHVVSIKVVARAEPGAETARFAIAYATNEVGNSGWQWFDAGVDWAVFELPYQVPAMVNGYGDFIALLPDQIGRPAIDILLITAQVESSGSSLPVPSLG